MSNSVEFSIDGLSDLVVKKWDEIVSQENLVDMGFKALSSTSITLLKKADVVSALTSAYSSKNFDDLAAKLAVPLVGLKLLAVTQVGTSLRIAAAHDSASCDQIGAAVFKIVGDTIGIRTPPSRKASANTPRWRPACWWEPETAKAEWV